MHVTSDRFWINLRGRKMNEKLVFNVSNIKYVFSITSFYGNDKKLIIFEQQQQQQNKKTTCELI